MFKTHTPTFTGFFKQSTGFVTLKSMVSTGVLAGVLLLSVFVMSQGEAVDCEAVRAQYQCPLEKHKLHLSFDDGVGSVTDKVLDVLKRENIKATFFVMGNKIDCSRYPSGQSAELCQKRLATLNRIKLEGHNIGSHSYEHHRHTLLSPEDAAWNIKKSKALLASYFTTEPPVFRLPNGDGWFNQKEKPFVMNILKQEGFEHIGWEMTAYDWNEKFQNGDKILDNVMGQMCKGKGRDGIVLFHDGVHENEHEGRLFTANNLARWIPKLRCAADFKPLFYFRKNLVKK